ncbi:hypothetical protein GCM10027321_05360 [Massilia terrae]|uniref:DUF4124 domain-containing protein n=1 Tax=Massilia terrae TaxID=1811224 RepID=A0ABT2CSZ1_9BURK|nr:DUF4124 domain-containing protein [Massilia terrae]MCS0657104.1 DUF4124 domain-containing protein [Massilia terrae]
MRPTLPAQLPRLLGAFLLLAYGIAHAQFAWVDEKGVKHYSDRPPPPGTPASKILKTPGKPAELFATPEQAEVADAKSADAGSAPKQPTLAEREADFRKRAQDRAKEEKKAADEAQRQQAQHANCEQAQRYKNALDSGMRMTESGSDGGPQWMSDESRARHLAETNNVLAACR